MSTSAAAIIERERRRSGAVVDLARHLAIAVRVEPALLRAMRLRHFRSATVAVETDLWFSPLVKVRDPSAMVLRADAREMLLEELQQPVHASVRENAWIVIQQVHRDGPPVMRLEEHATYLAVSGRISDMERIVGGALDALVADSTGGIARWAARSLSRMPKEIRQSAAALALGRAAAERLGPITVRGLLDVGGTSTGWSPDMVRTLPRVSLFARIVATPAMPRSVTVTLEVGNEEFPAADAGVPVVATLAVPATRPLVLDVLAPNDTGWREQRLSIEPGVRASVTVPGGPLLRLRNLLGDEVRLKPAPSSEAAVIALAPAVAGAWTSRSVLSQAEDLQWQVVESSEDPRAAGMPARSRSASQQIQEWLTSARPADIGGLTRALLISRDEAAFGEWFAHTRAVSSPQAQPQVPAEAFYGREDVLREMRAFTADHDERYILVILGRPGTGKSALLREFVRNHRLGHAHVVYYAAERDLSDDELGAALAAIVPGWAELDPECERLPGHERLLYLLRLASAAGTISATRPLVIVVDGLDGSDKDAGGVLELLSVLGHDTIPGVRIVTSARERPFTEPPIDEPFRRLDLDEERWQPSGGEAVREFWKHAQPRFGPPEDVLADAIRVSDGNMRVATMLFQLLAFRSDDQRKQRGDVPNTQRLRQIPAGLPGVVQLVRDDVARLGTVSQQEARSILLILSVARQPIPLRELAPGYIDEPSEEIHAAIWPLLAPAADRTAGQAGAGYAALADRTSIAPALTLVVPGAGGPEAHAETLDTLRRFTSGAASDRDDARKPFEDWAASYLSTFTIRHLAGAGRVEELVRYCARAEDLAAPFRDLGYAAGRRELEQLDALRPPHGWPEPLASYLQIIDTQARWIRRDSAALPALLWMQLRIDGHDLEDPAVARAYGLDGMPQPIRLTRPLGRLPTEPTGRQVLDGHTGPVSSCAISDGSITTGDSGRDIPIVKGEEWYPSLAMHRAVSASKDGSARIWDLDTGHELFAPLRHSGGLTAIAISRDGRKVSVGALDGSVFRWHPQTPGLGARWPAHHGPVSACVFGEQLFFTGGEDGTVQAFDLVGQGTRQLMSWHHPVVGCFAIGPEIAAVHADGHVQLADVASGQQVRHFDFRGPVSFCSLRRHESAIVAMHIDGAESVLDLRSGEVRVVQRSHQAAAVSAFEESGDTHFAAVARKRQVTLTSLSAAAGVPVVRELVGHREAVRSLAFGTLRERPVLLSASEDHTLKLWDCTTCRELVTLGTSASASGLLAAGGVIGFGGIPVVASGATAAATRVIAYPTSVTRLAIYNVDESTPLFERDFGAPVVACAFAPANRLTVLLESGVIHMVGGFQSDVTPVGESLTGGKRATAFAAHDRVIIAAGVDGRLAFSRSPGQEPQRADAHDGIVRRIAIDANGERAASVGDDGAVLLWDVSAGRLLRRMAESEAADVVCLFSPDNGSVVTASVSGAVEAFDVEEHAARMLQGHVASVNGLAFKEHAGGLRLISASDDTTLGVLDFASGRQLGVLLGHTRPVVGCASVPLSGRVISWSLDRTIRLWDIETFQCVGTIYGHAPFISVSVVPATAGNRSTVPDAPPGPQMPVLVALDASGMVWLLTVSDGNVPASTSTRQA